jgi:Cys-Gly metallodipeptidase DUG1
MSRMRLPLLLLHGIEGAFAVPGAKTVIPAKVGGKFSIRWVRFPSFSSLFCVF